jgi:large subunit ribosomal protein L10
VSLGGQVLPGGELEKVASLPTRAQALSMLLGVMKAPIQKFVATLAEPPAKLARTLDAVRAAKPAA